MLVVVLIWTRASFWIACRDTFMKMTDKSKSGMSIGDLMKPDPEPASTSRKSTHQRDTQKSILLKSVLVQAIKDCLGSAKARAEVIVWLVSDDFPKIVEPLGYNADELRLKIATILTFDSKAMATHYCNKLLQEII